MRSKSEEIRDLADMLTPVGPGVDPLEEAKIVARVRAACVVAHSLDRLADRLEGATARLDELLAFLRNR